MRLFILVSFLAGIILSGSVNSYAQNHSFNDSLSVSVWAGYSFQSVRFLGKTTNAQSVITGIGVRKHIHTYTNGNHLYYTADLIPYIKFDYPKRDDGNRRATRTGWGLSPIGFMLKKPLNSGFTPYLHAAGSMIYMEKEFPTDLSRKFNFTFGLSFGTDISLSNNLGVSLGYKFHHISNAQTGEQNPGLDSNFLYLSLTIN